LLLVLISLKKLSQKRERSIEGSYLLGKTEIEEKNLDFRRNEENQTALSIKKEVPAISLLFKNLQAQVK